MEDGVAFIEPAGLRVDQVGKGPARERRRAIGYSFGVEVIDGSSSFGIEQGSFGCDINRRAQSCDVEFDDVLGGKTGMDFDDTVECRERFALDPQTVASERKIASGQVARVVSGKGAVKLGGVTGEFDGRLDGETVGAYDFDAEFSSVTLRLERKSQKENAEMERPAHSVE
jgi:hypothetical protein